MNYSGDFTESLADNGSTERSIRVAVPPARIYCVEALRPKRTRLLGKCVLLMVPAWALEYKRIQLSIKLFEGRRSIHI